MARQNIAKGAYICEYKTCKLWQGIHEAQMCRKGRRSTSKAHGHVVCKTFLQTNFTFIQVTLKWCSLPPSTPLTTPCLYYTHLYQRTFFIMQALLCFLENVYIIVYWAFTTADCSISQLKGIGSDLRGKPKPKMNTVTTVVPL